jgi:hypothetical protein
MQTPSFEQFAKTLRLNRVIQILNSLDEGQKEWYAMALFELVTCNGIPDNLKSSYAIGMLADIGIDKEKYSAIIKKTQALIKHHS